MYAYSRGAKSAARQLHVADARAVDYNAACGAEATSLFDEPRPWFTASNFRCGRITPCPGQWAKRTRRLSCVRPFKRAPTPQYLYILCIYICIATSSQWLSFDMARVIVPAARVPICRAVISRIAIYICVVESRGSHFQACFGEASIGMRLFNEFAPLRAWAYSTSLNFQGFKSSRTFIYIYMHCLSFRRTIWKYSKTAPVDIDISSYLYTSYKLSNNNTSNHWC